MPDSPDLNVLLRRLDAVERNHTMLASSVTNMVKELDMMQTPLDELRLDRAVRVERDKHIHERFDRLEASMKGMYRLGWWLLVAVGTSAIAFVMNFIFKGGFNVVG